MVRLIVTSGSLTISKYQVWGPINGPHPGLDQKSKTEEVVPKMARRRGLNAGQLRRKRSHLLWNCRNVGNWDCSSLTLVPYSLKCGGRLVVMFGFAFYLNIFNPAILIFEPLNRHDKRSSFSWDILPHLMMNISSGWVPSFSRAFLLHIIYTGLEICTDETACIKTFSLLLLYHVLLVSAQAKYLLTRRTLTDCMYIK